MRVLGWVALVLLILEALVGFACYAGYAWLGGGWAGTALVLGVLLLIVIPWLGDLVVEYDSGSGLKVRLAWWAALQIKFKPREARFRILFITWRKAEAAKPRSHKRRRPQAAKKKASPWPAVGKNLGGIGRVVLAGLQALGTLLAEAKELRIIAKSLTQNDMADAVLAGVVSEREAGPVRLELLSGGQRRVEVHYRIGLLRACLTALYAALQSRPVRTLRAVRADLRAAQAESALAQFKEAE